MTYKGIDVSAHNGTINWTKVKADGIRFAMLRMGYSTVTDKKFIEYYKGAKAAGIAVGGYWFSYALNVSGAIAEAEACAKLLAAYPLDLPVYFDFEDDTERYAKQNGIVYTNALRTSIHQAFCSRLNVKGYKVGIYANENYIKNLLNWSALSDWPLWLAKWPGYSTGKATGFSIPADSVPIYGKTDAWQFTDSGTVSGISGKVDLDWYYGQIKSAGVHPDDYTADGLTYHRCNMFLIVYHDAKKVGANYGNYCNAGFFSPGAKYTLPVANLVCEPWSIPIEGRAEVVKHLVNGKIRFTTDSAHTNQFRGKKVSTLIVPQVGSPYIEELSEPAYDCKYAVSGIPCLRNGTFISQSAAMAQGWDASPFYSTSRSAIGLRNGEIWIVTGKGSHSDFCNKMKLEGFADAILMDGGGSYYYKNGNTVKRTFENRRVNNLIVFT